MDKEQLKTNLVGFAFLLVIGAAAGYSLARPVVLEIDEFQVLSRQTALIRGRTDPLMAVWVSGGQRTVHATPDHTTGEFSVVVPLPDRKRPVMLVVQARDVRDIARRTRVLSVTAEAASK